MHDAWFCTRRSLRWSTTMLTILALGACAADAPPKPEATARVIVGFRSALPDPSTTTSLAALAARAGVPRITLIRPMSGDAYVVEVACGDAGGVDPCGAAIARLAAVESVRFAEADRRERIRSP